MDIFQNNLLTELIIGSLTMGVTILVHAEMFAAYYKLTKHNDHPLWRYHGRFRHGRTMAYSVFWVLLAITVEVWLWAIVLLLIGAVQGLEPAVYFALVCFTTLGFGDMVLTQEWRVLSALIAANGLLIFGWSTAFMFDVMQTSHNRNG